MNENNLKPFTVINARENGAKGGKVSGESKREKKLIREYLTELLAMQAPKEEIDTNYNIGNTNGAMVAVRTLKRAKEGDTRALRLLFEVIGELDTKGKISIEILDIEIKKAYENGYNQAITDIMQELPDDVVRNIAGLTDTK